MNLIKNNKFLIFIFLIIATILYGYSYLYKGHKDIEFASESFNGTTLGFARQVSKTPSLWLDKTIVLKGKITLIEKNGVTLDHQIYCQFKDSQTISKNMKKQITIKGKMIGYDDLLKEIKLAQCTLQK